MPRFLISRTEILQNAVKRPARKKILEETIREKRWYNANIGSRSGGVICVSVPLTKIWGTHPLRPPVDFHDILAADQGELV